VLTIVLWDFVLDWLAYHVRFFSWLVRQSPLPLVKHGKMLRRNMRQELISADELRSQARQQGIAEIEDVEAACLEPNGEISFIKREGNQDAKGKRRRNDVV
jgi:uncharacterized membrane protein YcaP (DUF421 family)